MLSLTNKVKKIALNGKVQSTNTEHVELLDVEDTKVQLLVVRVWN